MDPKLDWSLDGLSFSLCSIFVPAFPLDEQFWIKNLDMGGYPHPSPGGHVYLLEVVSSGSISRLLGILAKVGQTPAAAHFH